MNPWKLSTVIFASLFTVTLATQAFQTAEADKGGHRAKAITLTTQAIAEVEKGISFDNRH